MTDRPAADSVFDLFVYGTLQPGDDRWPFLAPYVVDGGRPDTVAGLLYDTGLRYPAANFGPNGTIHGRRFTLRRETLDDALRELDDVESAVEGLYRRVLVVCGSGSTAWAYEFGGGVALTPIPHGNWRRHLGLDSGADDGGELPDSA